MSNAAIIRSTYMSNAAIIMVDGKTLLKRLQFEGGTIREMRIVNDRWESPQIEIVIEHPDLDEVHEGWHLMKIKPIYLDKVDIINGKEYHTIERTDPPKREAAE